MGPGPVVGRRGALAFGAASVLTACGSRSVGTAAPSGSHGSPTTSSAPPLGLPAFVAWKPLPGDLQIAAKLAAVRTVEQSGNTTGHRLHVIDAQYGGLLTDAASVLVVCESWHLDRGRVVTGGHTFDVRLIRTASGWRVTAVHRSDPGSAASALSTAARHTLANARISLPPAARADIASGQVHDTVLEAMLALSQRWSLAISVIRSGHPQYVFGTSRLSDHPRGRAFDTWAIDQIPVVSRGEPNPVVPAYMEAVAGHGSYNVGGPVLLGSAPQFFSDQTHHDHVHAGFLT